MKNKHILITGGSGFIGSHLTKRCLQLGAEVSVIVKYDSIIDNIRLSSIWDCIKIIEADLRNIDSLRALQNKSYDYVFHLAAYNHVGHSFLHVNEALACNLLSTANFLEFCPEFDRFLYMSSSESYGFQESVPFKEDSIPFPISPYAIGKYAGELFARMKRFQTGKGIICVRPFNTFGPYQSEKAIIPEMIIKCLRGISIQTTEGRQTREFNYVENIIDGLLAAIEQEKPFDGIINIGSGEEIAIKELVQKIHSLCESKSELKIGALQYRPTEIWRMSAAKERAEKILNWKPGVSFDEGLKKTIAWFKDYVSLFFKKQSSLNRL
ncbi:GDP-mannose 4,6-dehydratase [Candidatus Riflebacteria bacterium]